MIKILTYIEPLKGVAAGDFLKDYRSQFVPEILEKYPEIAGCTLNLVDDDYTGGLPGEKMSSEDAEQVSNYVGASEYWIDASPARIGEITQSLLRAPGRVDAYWVEEHVAKDSPEAAELPVLRLMSPCRPVPGLSALQIFQSWRDHIERANRIHIGMSRYLQNWHMAPLNEDAPKYFGTPMLSFQTLDAWENNFYVDEAGAQEIADDVGSFVESFVPLLTREYRLKQRL